MARELIAESRITKNPNDAYAAAANVALGEIMTRWTSGLGPPSLDARVENIHVHNPKGKLIGFRLYLVGNEPMVFGKTPVEVVDDA